MDDPQVPQIPPVPEFPLASLIQPPPTKVCVPPQPGEVITSLRTNSTYVIGQTIGEGHFGIVYSCQDIWQNDLAAKVLKPLGTYEKVKASAESEFIKLMALRHPTITYIYDAFEYRDTFYIITERCLGPVTELFALKNFNGLTWLMPIARCLLQAVHYLHINGVVHQDIHARNVFATFVKDEMPTDAKAMQFKLADLGVANLFTEINAQNTRDQQMLPPEVLRPQEFGPIDYRIDLYHVALLLLQLALSREVTFSEDEILGGKPREMAELLPQPLNFALGKALRRHVAYRTSGAMELWRDLRFPQQSLTAAPQEPSLPPAPTA